MVRNLKSFYKQALSNRIDNSDMFYSNSGPSRIYSLMNRLNRDVSKKRNTERKTRTSNTSERNTRTRKTNSRFDEDSQSYDSTYGQIPPTVRKIIDPYITGLNNVHVEYLGTAENRRDGEDVYLFNVSNRSREERYAVDKNGKVVDPRNVKPRRYY